MEQASGYARSRSESGLQGNNVGSYARSTLLKRPFIYVYIYIYVYI